jgi:hypothetical protein
VGVTQFQEKVEESNTGKINLISSKHHKVVALNLRLQAVVLVLMLLSMAGLEAPQMSNGSKHGYKHGCRKEVWIWRPLQSRHCVQPLMWLVNAYVPPYRYDLQKTSRAPHVTLHY